MPYPDPKWNDPDVLFGCAVALAMLALAAFLLLCVMLGAWQIVSMIFGV